MPSLATHGCTTGQEGQYATHGCATGQYIFAPEITYISHSVSWLILQSHFQSQFQ